MSRLEFATYQLQPQTTTCLQDAVNRITQGAIQLRELTTIDDVNAFIKPTEPSICRLLIVEGDHLREITSDLDINQPLVILQLWDNLSDVQQMPASLATSVTIASVKLDIEDMTTILRRMLAEVKTRWERLVRLQIQSAYDETHLSIAKNSSRTSPFLDLFLKNIQEILQATSLTLGCVGEVGGNLNIIHKIGKPVLSIADFKSQIRNLEENNQIETSLVQTEPIIAIASSLTDPQHVRILLLYEFESLLPTQILLDICDTATREFHRLQDYCSGKAITEPWKMLADAQRKLPDEDSAKKWVLEYLQKYFNAKGASILLITRQDGQVLTLEKTFMHYNRYAKVILDELVAGFPT